MALECSILWGNFLGKAHATTLQSQRRPPTWQENNKFPRFFPLISNDNDKSHSTIVVLRIGSHLWAALTGNRPKRNNFCVFDLISVTNDWHGHVGHVTFTFFLEHAGRARASQHPSFAEKNLYNLLRFNNFTFQTVDIHSCLLVIKPKILNFNSVPNAERIRTFISPKQKKMEQLKMATKQFNLKAFLQKWLMQWMGTKYICCCSFLLVSNEAFIVFSWKMVDEKKSTMNITSFEESRQRFSFASCRNGFSILFMWKQNENKQFYQLEN